MDQQAVQEHKKKLETNPFYKLENANADKLAAAQDIPRLEKLIEIKEKDRDYFEWNQMLRKRNREARVIEKKELEEAKKPRNFGLELVKDIDDEEAREEIRAARVQQSALNYRKSKMAIREEIRH